MKKNKVVIVGTGMVGMSYAYSMLNQGTCEELVLIDLDKKRAIVFVNDENSIEIITSKLNYHNYKAVGIYERCLWYR